VDPQCITSHYYRPIEEDKMLGLLDDDAIEEKAAKFSGEEAAELEWKSYEDVKNEVLHFPGACQSCGAPCETRMKPTGL
jgi:hypothetical protein